MSESHYLQLILVGALAVDAFAGEYPDRFHPVIYMGNYIKFLWSRRPGGQDKVLFQWGLFLTLSGAIIFFIPPMAVRRFIGGIPGIIVSFFMLKAAFACRALTKAAREVESALKSGDLVQARELTSYHLVSRDTSDLSAGEISGAVIESVAENLTDAFVSPLFFYSLGGIPAAWAYRFVNTCDSLLGYRKDDFEWGGKFAARLDDLLNWIPARLAGGLIVLSAFITGEDWKRGWDVMLESRRRTSSPNAGWTMAAMAGALGVTLEKRGEYELNGGSAEPDCHFIGRALRIVRGAVFIFSILTIALLEVLK